MSKPEFPVKQKKEKKQDSNFFQTLQQLRAQIKANNKKSDKLKALAKTL
jgi:hypothetical protein